MLNNWFKNHIDTLKQKNKWNNFHIAHLFGFSRMSLHRYITGERSIEFDLLWAICDILSKHVEEEAQILFMDACLHVMNQKLKEESSS